MAATRINDVDRVESATGLQPPQFVPLGQLASIELVRSPNEFWRENQQPVITVTAEQGDKDLGAINRQLSRPFVEVKISARLSLGAWPADTVLSKIRSPACSWC